MRLRINTKLSGDFPKSAFLEWGLSQLTLEGGEDAEGAVLSSLVGLLDAEVEADLAEDEVTASGLGKVASGEHLVAGADACVWIE